MFGLDFHSSPNIDLSVAPQSRWW